MNEIAQLKESIKTVPEVIESADVDYMRKRKWADEDVA